MCHLIFGVIIYSEAEDLNNETLEHQVPTMIYGSWYTLFDVGSLT